MPILFNRCVSLQVDPITSIFARSIISSSQQCLFHPSPSYLRFPSLPPYFLFKYHFNVVKSLHSFTSMFLSVNSQEDANEASSSSLFTRFLLRWIQFKLLVLIISFPRFKCLVLLVHLIIIHLSLFFCSGVLKISRRFVFPLCFHSSSFEDVISFKPSNSTGAISLFKQSFQRSFF